MPRYQITIEPDWRDTFEERIAEFDAPDDAAAQRVGMNLRHELSPGIAILGSVRRMDITAHFDNNIGN
jgi:hypothetical protein